MANEADAVISNTAIRKAIRSAGSIVVKVKYVVKFAGLV